MVYARTTNFKKVQVLSCLACSFLRQVSSKPSMSASCAAASTAENSCICSSLMVAAPFGLPITDKKTPEEVADGLGKAIRPPVVWLHFQDCTGCTETLLRTSHPDLGDLILNIISLEYHETLMAAAGHQAEEALQEAVAKFSGKYVCIVEGSIPTRDKGIYMKLAGRPALQVLDDVGGKAAALIAIGSCASWGGIPSADPDPTGAVGVADLLPNKTIINIPGCPPNPYTLLGVVLQFAESGTLPELDAERRPKFAFDRNIHDHCPRRAHFDAGHFVKQFGDDGHREGWCLYEMGAKAPTPTLVVRRVTSTRFPTCGRSVSARRALDARRKVLRSACRCLRLCKSILQRIRRTRMHRSTPRKERSAR